MAEVFGMVSARLGLLGFVDSAISLTDRFVKYVRDLKDEKHEHAWLVSEVAALRTMLPSVKKCLLDCNVTSERYIAVKTILEGPSSPLLECMQALVRINNKLDLHFKSSSSGDAGAAPPQKWSRLMWPFKKADIIDELGKIEQFKSLATIIMVSGLSKYA